MKKRISISVKNALKYSIFISLTMQILQIAWEGDLFGNSIFEMGIPDILYRVLPTLIMNAAIISVIIGIVVFHNQQGEK